MMNAYWNTYQQFPNGGQVIICTLVDVQKFSHELLIALLLAKEYGWIVELLPEVPEGDPLRLVLLPGVRQAKNPDYRINGVYADLKSPLQYSTYDYLRNRIEEAVKQADIAIVELQDTPTLGIDENSGTFKIKRRTTASKSSIYKRSEATIPF